MSAILIILALHATSLLVVQVFGLSFESVGRRRVALRVPTTLPTGQHRVSW